MNSVEVTGETIVELSKLVKKAGEQQRAIVYELSKELGQHNQLVEMAVENQQAILQRAIKLEEHMKSRPSYQYERISKIIDAQRLEEQKRIDEKKKQLREKRQQEYLATP